MSHYYTNIQGWLQEPFQDYCPVALKAHLIKILEKILAKNIYKFLKIYQTMNPKQHGFHSGRSCLSQLLENQNKILEELEKSNIVGVIYIDFAKKFDKVDHRILLNKLKKMKFIVKSVCGNTIFYQTDNNVFPPMEQHQVKLK